jgi:ribose/xylose/arabinose/galactoside ABC-type transport system permease subunit
MTSIETQAKKKKVLIPEAYRPVFGAALFFILMMVAFIVSAPEVFLTVGIYTAIFLSLPLFTIVGLSLVYITAAGEIDLSFPSIIAISALAFTWTLQQTQLNFGLAILASILTGTACGWLNGILETRLGLSSLITTLGMNFALVGLTNILNNGVVRGLVGIEDSKFRAILVGSWGPMPAQMFWSAGIAIILGLIFHRHRFGIHVKVAGDNPEAGRAMGVNIERTKTLAFILIGVCSALTGIFAVLLNSTFFPTMGDGYLLPTLAAVFVGGTPVTGGKGTIGGLVIGAATVVFIQTGVVAAGLDGYWTSLGFGLVIVLSLIGHRRFSGKLTR